ncbi:single-strand DNA-binding protein [Mycoplasmopsis mustelae]|uniref:Single-stranded DNA-binding protein n=1 Tax=Mycoplasmopsis mustelae TaxID=171289 RepID=A0A4R7UCD3_9BACT|nr:single-stranded DNA-binding protein [Mycoplasmopsis mustelae]TDV24078.1 single-strand DNA-binding protein [Mycoplasmopsis mustelae]
MNKVILIGRTTTDIELNSTSSGTPYVRLTLAVQRRIQSKNDVTDFIPLVAWGTNAVLFKNSVPKGSLIAIEGTLQSNSYVSSKTNQTIRALDVHVDNITFLESKRVTDERLKQRGTFDDFTKKTTYENPTFTSFNNTNQFSKDVNLSTNLNTENSKNEVFENKKSVDEKLHDLDDLDIVDEDIDVFN